MIPAFRNVEVVDPQPLTLLPEPEPGDLFFDFEGDPLWTADGREWGLEYLFGVLEAGPTGKFRPLWAHNRVDERKALSDFLAMVAKRRKRHPNMHIYHYAPYEKTALLRLAGTLRRGRGRSRRAAAQRSRWSTCIRWCARAFAWARSRSASRRWSRCTWARNCASGDVTTATGSITSYARYCELQADGRGDEAATVLKEIEDYNHYDCRSTQQAARLADVARL